MLSKKVSCLGTSCNRRIGAATHVIRVPVVLQVIQRTEREDQSGDGKQQQARAAQGMAPIRRRDEQKEGRYQRHDGELEDMRPRAFIRLRRLRIPAQYSKQRNGRKKQYNSGRDVVDFRLTLIHENDDNPPASNRKVLCMRECANRAIQEGHYGNELAVSENDEICRLRFVSASWSSAAEQFCEFLL